MTASQRWKAKKQKAKDGGAENTAESSGNKEDMLKLTGFADSLVCMGNLEIYHDTYEKLSFKVKAEKEKAEKKLTSDFDMFADDDVGNVAGKGEGSTGKSENGVKEAEKKPSESGK